MKTRYKALEYSCVLSGSFRQVWCFQNLQICLVGLQKYSDDALDVLEFIFKNFLTHLGTSSL